MTCRAGNCAQQGSVSKQIDLLSKDKSLCNDIVSQRNNRYEWITCLTTWCLHLKLTSIELLPILICEPPRTAMARRKKQILRAAGPVCSTKSDRSVITGPVDFHGWDDPPSINRNWFTELLSFFDWGAPGERDITWLLWLWPSNSLSNAGRDEENKMMRI